MNILYYIGKLNCMFDKDDKYLGKLRFNINSVNDLTQKLIKINNLECLI